MKKLYHAKAFIKYFFCIKYRKGHNIQSPFLYDFFTSVLYNKYAYYAFDEMSGIVPDYQYRKTDEIIFKILDFVKARNILEIDTGSSVSTEYLLKYNKKASVICLNFCNEMEALCKEELIQYKDRNINILSRTKTPVTEILSNMRNPVNVAIFNMANNTKNTCSDISSCINKTDEKSIFIIKDINYNKRAYNAWKKIIFHNDISFSIETIDFGIIFFKKDLPRKNIRIQL